MFQLHLILTGVTFLLTTHFATSSQISDRCEPLLRHVSSVWIFFVSAVPDMEQQAAMTIAQMGLDVSNFDQVTDVVCNVADATSQKELADALNFPYGQFKTYHGYGLAAWLRMGQMDGMRKMLSTFTTVMVALEDAGYPYQWPMTKTYDEWLTLVTKLVDEAGSDFMKWLAPQVIMQPFPIPTVDDPAYFARQLTDATSLTDFATRINLDPRTVESILYPVTMAIQMGKVDEWIALAQSTYDLIEYADSIGLAWLPEQ